MLKTIDIILGLSIVMLVVSMAVTVLTQIVTTLLSTRGKHLRDGLIDLLNQIDPALAGADSKEIAETILTHPLIRDTKSGLGTLVHRDEFTRLLIELASGKGLHNLAPDARTALVQTLHSNGICDPEEALHRIREMGLELEISHPTLAANTRHDVALLHAANSDLVAKINAWFDQTIDRISARFTFTTRQISFAAALVVALGLQFDSLVLVRRVAAGDLVHKPQDIIVIGALRPERLPGIALSTLLLSLGAPFWFEILKDVLRLRPAIAIKDDEQRTRRQSPAIDTPER